MPLMNEEIEASYVLFICILPAIGLWHVKNAKDPTDEHQELTQEKFLSYGRILTLHYYFLLMCITLHVVASSSEYFSKISSKELASNVKL